MILFQVSVFAVEDARRSQRVLHREQTSPSLAFTRQLEDEVGLPLFERLGKQISLTEAGRELYHYSRSIERALARQEKKHRP